MAREDLLGDKLKAYEDNRRLISGNPIIARLDGVNFHNWTRHLKRPYDERLSKLMLNTTQTLVIETNAIAGYTQSDEVSLTWFPEGESEPIYGGKIQKIASILASIFTAQFNEWIPDFELDESSPAIFDCRVFQVPDVHTAGDYFAWRQQDARKNAVSMAARNMYSHNVLQDKHSKEMIEMLKDKGVVFSDYPPFFREGQFFLRRKELRKYTLDEISKLPIKHQARSNPDLVVERNHYIVANSPGIVSYSWWIYGK